ncbi:MAG: PilN domain-containing protein, partial [Planctomycetota bacterium]
MIKVNLLPAEYRKVERTPIMRFVVILCGVVLSASAIGAFLYVHFGMLVEVVSDREKLEETYLTKKVIADRSRALSREASEYKKRRETIERIGKSRMLWSQKLDELCDIIHNKGDTKRHQVWLNQLRTLAASGDSPGGIYFKGFSGGAEIHRLSDFHLDLKNSDFFQDFTSIDNPEG